MATSNDGLERSLARLSEAAVAVARADPATLRSVREAERVLGLRFPASYRSYLMAVGPMAIEYPEATSRMTLRVYGLCKRTTGLPNLVWANSLGSKKRDHLLRFAQDATQWSRVYRRFTLDLGLMDAAPVFSSKLGTFDGSTGPIANDFASWLSVTLDRILPLSLDMWRRRLEFVNHSTTTKEYGQPGPPVFFSECECGWSSALKLSHAQALRDGQGHAAEPEAMRAVAWWN